MVPGLSPLVKEVMGEEGYRNFVDFSYHLCFLRAELS